MALETTENLKQGIRVGQFSPSLVLRIDGIEEIFTNVAIKKYIRIGDPGLLIGSGWVIGGFNLVDPQSPYISYNTGETTSRITQKLDPSRGLGSSVSQMAITMIDKAGEITNMIAPGKRVEDILGRFCTVYLGVEESAWPEDYNTIFQGVIEQVAAAPNEITFYLNNTEEKKRARILAPLETETTTPTNYRSRLIQDIFWANRDDVVASLSVQYAPGGTAGAEVVDFPSPTTIRVTIESGVSTAAQIRRAVEDNSEASQLVTVKIQGDSSTPQVSTAVLPLLIATTIEVLDASEFLLPQDVMRTYAAIGDELIEYDAKTPTTLAGITRAQEGSLAEVHKAESTIEQVVRITDNGINLALKLMLSQGPEYYAEEIAVASYEYFDALLTIPNAVFFTKINLERDLGVSAGDSVTFEDAINPANNITTTIAEVGIVSDGAFIILNDNVIQEMASTATAKFKTPFNTLPIGLGMTPREVDVKQHLFIRDTFLPIFMLDLFLRDIEVGKDFLEREIYLPMTCYSVPRKARSSAVLHVGPLPTYDIKTLDATTVRNPERLRVQRGLSENFFNGVQFKYNYDPIDLKPRRFPNFKSTKVNKIPVGERPFVIEAHGLRTELGGDDSAAIAARRYLLRYERGAEYIKGISVDFRTGYEIEIGDVVAVDFASLKMSDFKTGDRLGEIRLMEVLNKTLDNKTAQVHIDVVNTIFGVNDRYGLISPASETLAGSSLNKVVVAKSYGTRAFERESNKWVNYIGQDVIIRSPDWTQVYTTKILGFDNLTPQSLLIQAIPVAPGAGWLLEAVPYPTSDDQRDQAFWKLRHAFFSPQVQVVNAISLGENQFEVAPGDVDKFFIGSDVLIHDYEYTQVAPEASVVDITGNIVTINLNAGFNISDVHYIDLIGFADRQPAYRIT